MFVKNLPGQMRHCGSLPSHERSHNPDKETRAREETNKREEVIVCLWPSAINTNTWVCVCLCSGAFCGRVGSRT